MNHYTRQPEPGRMEQLLDRLDQCDDAAMVAKRREPWWPYRTNPIEVQLTEPGGSTRSVRAVARNLSRGGISLVCSHFLHQGTMCRLKMMTIENARQIVAGVVRRCEHIGGQIHQVGVQFDEPLDIARFLPLKLPGRILLVDDNQFVARMTSRILQKAEAETVIVETGEAALAAAERMFFDLILMDLQLPGMDGLETTRTLRQRGVQTPIIAFTARGDEAARQECLDAGCTDFLSKPVERHELLRKMLSHLSDAPPLISTLHDDTEMEDLVASFVAGLPGLVAQCRVLRQRGDDAGLLMTVRDLKAAAGAHGFAPLAEQAKAVEAPLSGAIAGEEVRDEVDGALEALLALAERVRGNAAPAAVAAVAD